MMSPRIKSPEKSLHPHMGDGNRIVRQRCGGAYLNTTRNVLCVLNSTLHTNLFRFLKIREIFTQNNYSLYIFFF